MALQFFLEVTDGYRRRFRLFTEPIRFVFNNVLALHGMPETADAPERSEKSTLDGRDTRLFPRKKRFNSFRIDSRHSPPGGGLWGGKTRDFVNLLFCFHERTAVTILG